MSDQFVGEIRIFGCNFAPHNWAQCNGQILSIMQNTALFSLLGTAYGGDGKATFALPNLQGRAALDQDREKQYSVGQLGGVPSVTLLQNEMPRHNHTALGNTATNSANPSGLTWGNPVGRPAPNYFANAAGTAQTMSPQALSQTGGNLPHNNLMPYQVLNFCIALQGVYPQRP